MTSQAQTAPRIWKDQEYDRDLVARLKTLPWARILTDAIILFGMFAVSSSFLISK